MNDETAVLALVERLERTVKSEEDLQKKLELEITVRKRLREELDVPVVAVNVRDSYDRLRTDAINKYHTSLYFERALEALCKDWYD